MKVISFKELIDLEPKPKKVKYDSFDFNWNEMERDYMWHDEFLQEYISITKMNDKNIELNDEIEIIEEDKPMKYLMQLDTRETQDCIIKTQDKINEIIDQLNEMRNKQ